MMFKKKDKNEVKTRKQEKINSKESLKEKEIDEKIDFNDEKLGDSISIFHKNKKDFKDFIATDIDFATDPRYTILGDNCYLKHLYVGTLPNSVNFAHFLYGLYNFGNIDTSVFINPVENEAAKSELGKLKTNLEMEYIESGGSNNRAEDMAVKINDAKRLRSEVRDGVNKIYEVSIVSTLYENDLRTLNNSTDILKDTLGQQDVGIKSAIYCQEDVYMSNKPFNKNRFSEWHTFDRNSLACIYPFTSSTINHQNGTPIGFNMDNGLPIIFDPFDLSLTNYNMVVFSRSGGGKSTFVKRFSSRGATLDNIQTIAIDVDDEYKDIAETLGGVNIIVAPNTDTVINPFDIVPDIIEDKTNGTEKEAVLLEAKINSVSAMLMTMAKGSTGNNPYYNDITLGIIKEITKAEYKNKGVTNEVESLYEYKEDIIIDGKISGGKVRKDMPTLTSWYKSLEEASKNNDNKTYQPYYDYLLLVMADYTKYKKGGFNCFDGQSTVQLSYDIPFINFNIAHLNENGPECGIAQHIICDFIWEKMVKRNNKGKKIRVIIDEAWRLVKQRESLDFLITMFRRARKKNTSTVVISQQFEEFYSPETKPIIKNSEVKLFLPPDETSVNDIVDVFQLTEGEGEFLRLCRTGEGLLKVGNLSLKLHIDLPDFELAFAETNQNKRVK